MRLHNVLSLMVCAWFLTTSASAATPTEALTAYLQALYARDYTTAYTWIASADRQLKTQQEYVQEHGAFTGGALEMAQVLASLIRVDNVQTQQTGEEVQLTCDISLPNANAPEILALLLHFDQEALDALSPAERTARARQLLEMAHQGSLPMLHGEREQWHLRREQGHWRVVVNWTRAVEIHFDAVTQAGLPWAFSAQQPVVRAIPGDTLQTFYRVKNLTNHTVTAKARHVLDPPADAGHLDIVSCFCFVQQTLAAGEETTLPVVFRVNYDLPATITQMRVRYEFYPIDKFPEDTSR